MSRIILALANPIVTANMVAVAKGTPIAIIISDGPLQMSKELLRTAHINSEVFQNILLNCTPELYASTKQYYQHIRLGLPLDLRNWTKPTTMALWLIRTAAGN